MNNLKEFFAIFKKSWGEHVHEINISIANIISFIKRYTAWFAILIFGIAITSYGLSKVSDNTKNLNKIVEQRVKIESFYDSIARVSNPKFTYMQKRDFVDNLLKSDTQYRALEVGFNEIETEQRNPSEAYGFTIIAACLAVMLSGSILFIYTRHNFVQDKANNNIPKEMLALEYANERLNRQLVVYMFGFTFTPIYLGTVYLISHIIGK